MKILENEPLSNWTFWKIGGPADVFCLPENIAEVKQAYAWAYAKKMDVTVIGLGTNVLVSDAGIRGVVVSLQKFKNLQSREEKGRLIIEASAGTPKSELLKLFLKARLSPALFLCGLPGDVGGGIAMNAGIGELTVPREFAEITDWFEVLRSGKIQRFEKNSVEWSYRHTRGWEPGIIVNAQFSWPLEPVEDIGQKVKDATRKRVASQPLTQPSCGSTFKNPPGQKAGALIDQCSLKGFQIGAAQVSPKHANFIVNLGGASAHDVDQVIKHVQKTVQNKFQISLETEVRYLGQWN